MKRCILLIVIVICALPLSAQVLDSLLWGRNIFELLNRSGDYGNRISLVQPDQLRKAVEEQVVQNRSKKIQGFRIRIFSSNAQNARSTSQAVKEEFESLYPHIPAYPKFENIDYRVLVGNFRTRSEAMRFHRELTTKQQYRGAVIVKETIDYPPL